jgi:hypothetical protein
MLLTLASAMLVPVFFSLFSKRVTAAGVVVAILLSLELVFLYRSMAT